MDADEAFDAIIDYWAEQFTAKPMDEKAAEEVLNFSVPFPQEEWTLDFEQLSEIIQNKKDSAVAHVARTLA